MTATRPQFACPVQWCAGDVAEHGGDGTMPEGWLHSSEPIPLSGPLWAVRWSTGSGPDRWAVNVGTYGAITDDADDADLVATLLEVAARELRARARQSQSI